MDLDLGRYVRAGCGVWWGQAAAEPTPLVHALVEQSSEIGPIDAFCGFSWDEWLTTRLPETVRLRSYGALGAFRELSRVGQLEVVACHYSVLPRLFAQRLLPCDVGLVQVAPPDTNGSCSLGVGVDYAADALMHTPTLIAEINARMPVTVGSVRIPVERFTAVVNTDRPLAQEPQRAADGVDRAIARLVASLVEDRDTIQIGVGALPAAVLECLAGHADLGMHSGIITDGVAALVDKGVLTGAYKEVDPGQVVTGTAIGSAGLYERCATLPALFRPASYTHALTTLGRLRSFVSINSAIEVDLRGQVGAEVRHSSYIGAVGGQADFSHAAATSGARSVIALRSTSHGESTINPSLRSGVVTTAAADVDAVVTEHGIAHLRGATAAVRARRLAAVAAPECREDLERAAACLADDR